MRCLRGMTVSGQGENVTLANVAANARARCRSVRRRSCHAARASFSLTDGSGIRDESGGASGRERALPPPSAVTAAEMEAGSVDDGRDPTLGGLRLNVNK